MGFFKKKDAPIYAQEQLDAANLRIKIKPTVGFRSLRVLDGIEGTDEDIRAFLLLCVQKNICMQNGEMFTKDMAANTLKFYYSMPEKKSNVIYKMALEKSDAAYPYLL